MRRVPNFLVVPLLLVAALAACGGDDDDATGQQSVASATTVDAIAATTTTAPAAAAEPVPGATASSATPSAPTPTADSSDGGAPSCPDATDVSAAYGAEVEFDEADAMTGAIGLVFCPYTEVIGPGTTDAFGGAPIPDDFSITLTDQNPVIPGDGSATSLDGLGEMATWSEIVGELAVWTGERGVIVSMTFPPPGDYQATAIALARLVV